MKGYIKNIEELSLKNTSFRKVLYTTKNSQVVLMHLNPLQDIGLETHSDLDQFIRVEAGEGEAIIDGKTTPIKAGFAVVIPAGANHNIKNTSANAPLKLYTVYSPPQHRDGVVHATKEEAESDTEHFDGKTTE